MLNEFERMMILNLVNGRSVHPEKELAAVKKLLASHEALVSGVHDSVERMRKRADQYTETGLIGSGVRAAYLECGLIALRAFEGQP